MYEALVFVCRQNTTGLLMIVWEIVSTMMSHALGPIGERNMILNQLANRIIVQDTNWASNLPTL